jgi:signal transduction histidine kinase
MARFSASVAPRTGGIADSTFDAAALELALGHRLPPARWIGWRLRLLLLAALAGCVGLFLLIGGVAGSRWIDTSWRATPDGGLLLVQAGPPGLQALQGRELAEVRADGLAPLPLDSLVLQRSPRWLVDDGLRARQAEQQAALTRHLQAPNPRLVFTDGQSVDASVQPRGLAGLGVLFWALCGLALVLYLIAMVVVLARPSARNLLYALITLSQAANLVCIALESMPGLGLPGGFARWDATLRLALDLVTGAAVMHSIALHPRRLPGHAAIGTAGWLLAAAMVSTHVLHGVPGVWWAVQTALVGYGAAAVLLLGWSYRLEPNPFAMVLRRFGVVAVGTLVLLTAAVAVADDRPAPTFNIAAVGSAIWYVFLASLLLLVPFLSRSRQMMREFAMLAGISTVATSLDLLFVAVFSLGQFASLTLALFVSLGAYAGARQWILNQMLGTRLLTTERMFEQLYRIAREVEARPESAGVLLTRLLRDVFEPLETLQITRHAIRTLVLRDGSTLLVPIPALADLRDGRDTPSPATVVLRFAQRGKRLFTPDDARLADGIVDQLRRAVAYDQAVERGRSEERLRIAQDLHDDIGARLLTLMYQAPTPEMEDYLRHTLQDLKTLTRGLAAASHPMAHAAAEWKADITQRLAAVQCDLQWSFVADCEVVLTVVQWSGLTRILRELVNNAITHSRATLVTVHITYERGTLSLLLCDDGDGREPAAWSHGLGLGGIRKRVKQLNGRVEWRENRPRGICCEVLIPGLGGSD